MFDSLSAVAEITGVDYDKWLTDLYGNDEDRKAAAIHAAQQVQSHDLQRVARKSRTPNAASRARSTPSPR